MEEFEADNKRMKKEIETGKEEQRKKVNSPSLLILPLTSQLIGIFLFAVEGAESATLPQY